jgi:nucleotide exchange factor SIL1
MMQRGLGQPKIMKTWIVLALLGAFSKADVLPQSNELSICDTQPDGSQHCYPKMFVPTNQFQVILPNQVVPPGLHVRLNLQTGVKEAKLMESSDGDQGNKYHGNDRMVLNLQKGQRQDLIIQNPLEQHDELNDSVKTQKDPLKTEIVYGNEHSLKDSSRKGLTVQEKESLQEIMDNMRNGTQAQILSQLKVLSEVILLEESTHIHPSQH